MKSLIRIETGLWVDLAEAQPGDKLQIDLSVEVASVQGATSLQQERGQIIHVGKPQILRTALTRNHWEPE